MHRMITRRRPLLGGMLLALVMSGLAGYGLAQNPMQGSAVLVPLNGTYTMQMTTKNPIKKATTTKDGVVSIRTSSLPGSSVSPPGLMIVHSSPLTVSA